MRSFFSTCLCILVALCLLSFPRLSADPETPVDLVEMYKHLDARMAVVESSMAAMHTMLLSQDLATAIKIDAIEQALLTIRGEDPEAATAYADVDWATVLYIIAICIPCFLIVLLGPPLCRVFFLRDQEPSHGD